MVNPRNIPGPAIEAHDPYVDEFETRNAEILSGFKESMESLHPDGSAQTWISGAVTCARWLDEYYDVNLEEASDEDLDDYLEWVAGEFDSTETAAGKLDGVRHLYRWMYRKGVVDDDPVDEITWDDLSLKKGRTRQAEALNQDDDYIAITREEVEMLWQDENIPSPALRNEIIIRLLWYTGMRASEIVQIKIEDVYRDEGRIRIHVQKTDEYRDVWYPPSRMEPLLNEWLGYRRDALSPKAKTSDYLLLTHQSKKMRASHVSRIVKQAAKNADINDEPLYVDAAGKNRWKVTGHTLRHSFATYHANVLETPIHILQDVMGHEDIDTTRKYISEDKEAQRRAMQSPWE